MKSDKPNNELKLYIKISDFVNYSQSTLSNMPKIAIFNSCNDYFLRLYDSVIQINKLMKISKNKRFEICEKIQNNFKAMKVLVKFFSKSGYIPFEKVVVLEKYIDEICNITGGYMRFLVVGSYS